MVPWRAPAFTRYLGVVATAALVLLAPRPSWGQDHPQLYRLYGIDGWIGGGVKFEEENRKRPDRPDQKEVEREFFEEIKLVTDSSIYHSRLLKIKGGVLLRLEQEERETEGPTSKVIDVDEFVNEYDLNLAFLPEHPFNLTLYGSRATRDVDTQFFPEFGNATERMGAHLRWRQKWAPMSLRASQTERVGAGVNTIEEETRKVIYRIDQNSMRRWTNFEYEWIDQERSDRRISSLQNSLTSHRGRFTNTVLFGPERHSRLSSTLQYMDQVGTFPREELVGRADLLLFHRPTFQTLYRYNGRMSKTDLDETRINDVEVGFQHKLYRNLITNATIGGEVNDIDTGQILEGRTKLDFDYIRSIPFGSVTAGALGQFRLRDLDFDTEVGQVVDERHIFGPSGTIQLNNDFALAPSIVVTGEGGVPIYLENSDYLVRDLGERTEIVRLIGGTIPVDGTVLLDYQFSRPRSQRFSVIDRGGRLGLNLFRTIQLTTSFRRSDRHIIDGMDIGGTDDTTTWISGASLNRWGLRLDATHEEYDSEVEPRLTDRLNSSLTLRLPFFRTTVSGSAMWSRTDFPNTQEFTEGTSYKVGVVLVPFRTLLLEGGALVRDEEGRRDIGSETVYFGRLRYQLRRIEFTLRAERIHEEEQTGEERDRDVVKMEVFRRF